MRLRSDKLNIKYDDRYKRRLMKNICDAKNFAINKCKQCLKEALKNGQAHYGVIDDEYYAYLSQFGVSSESSSSVWAEDISGDDRDRRVPKDDNGEDDTDPQYSMFLENLRKSGKSCALEVVNTNGISEFIKYETLGGPDDECGLQILTKFRNIREGEKIDTTKHSMNVSNEEKIESTKDSRNGQSSDQVDQQRTSASVEGNRRDLVVRKHFRAQCTDHVSHGTKGSLNKELHREDNHMSEPRSICDTENNMIDQCYQSFLNCRDKEGNGTVFVMNTGQRLKYGEEDESSSDTEIIVMDDAPDCGEGNFTPFVRSRVYYAPIETEEDDWQCPENPIGNGNSLFREEVMGILKRPYNQDEFDKLLQDVNVRKPIGGRNSRRRSRSFSNNKCSKSYLDHYTDLKKELDAARFDRPKMLNILRGFFYWLQNLSHEGAFTPWSDPLCRAVIPRVL